MCDEKWGARSSSSTRARTTPRTERGGAAVRPATALDWVPGVSVGGSLALPASWGTREAARQGTVTLTASRGSGGWRGDTLFQTLSSRISEDELGTHPEQGCRNTAPLLAPGPWCYYPARKLAHPTRAGDQTWKNV